MNMARAFAILEDHFKPCLDKLDIHQIENIDFIYLINLDHRPEKIEKCRDQLTPYNIYPYRFSAIYGPELSSEALNDLGVKLESWMQKGELGTYFPLNQTDPIHEHVHAIGRTYFCNALSSITIAIVLSHLSVLQDAYNSGYQTIWVMEDDIQIIQDPRIIPILIQDLDRLVGTDGWDILFTDFDTKNQQGIYVPCLGYAWRPNFRPSSSSELARKQNIGKDLRKIGARYGAYSMILRRSGIKKILDFFKTYQIFCAYDMDYFLPPGIQLFTVINDVVSTQPNAISDNVHPADGPTWFPF